MKQKTIQVFMFIMIILINGCSNYVEPKGMNLSSIIIAEYPKLSGGSGIDTELKIDNKSIYPERVASILPGKHDFSMEITAFYNGRAKHAYIKKFFLDIIPNHRYIIKITTDKKKLFKNNEDVNAQYIVLDNSKVVLQNKFLLKDSILLSKSSNGVDPMVMNSIIYSAVLSAGL